MKLKRLGIYTVIAVVLLAVGAVALAENKSPMFSRQVPGGLFVVTNDTQTTGNIWFVNSTTGTNAAGYGQNPDSPFATIDYAIGNCTASNGDWIMVMPGHTETLSASGAITADVAGIRIIGLGTGRNRPILTFSGTTCEVKVSASNVSLENMVFDMSSAGTGGFGAAHGGVSVYSTATDFKFLGNEVVLSDDAGGKVGYAILLSGGTRTQVADCNFYGSLDAGNAVSAIVKVGPRVDDVRISNCYMQAYVITSGAMVDGESNAVSGFLLHDCRALQANSGASLFELSGSQGLVVNTYAVNGSGVTQYKTTDSKTGIVSF